MAENTEWAVKHRNEGNAGLWPVAFGRIADKFFSKRLAGPAAVCYHQSKLGALVGAVFSLNSSLRAS